MAKGKKTYKVNSPSGLNVRQHPVKDAKILRVLAEGASVAADPTVDTPAGWLAVLGGGFVMAEYLK